MVPDIYILQCIIQQELEKLTKFPVKIRDIHKVEKNIVSESVFLVMKTEKNLRFKKYLDLLLTKEEAKSHFVLSKYFNFFMY